jgi:carbonic anhydrase
MLPAPIALQRLIDGNQRFASNMPSDERIRSCTHHAYTPGEQKPFAVVLGCSDSRVPPEILFDQGIGDLFVIRVAGNVVTPEIIASVEYAAAVLGTRLVLVLGHESCGAVQASLNIAQTGSDPYSPALSSLHECIRGSVDDQDAESNPTELLERAVCANIKNSVGMLKAESGVLTKLIESDGFEVIGAKYGLQSGHVELFEE